MMKTIKRATLIAVAVCFAIPAFSQASKTSTNKKVPSASGGTSLSADQSKMLCKAWKMDTVSTFGVDKKANAKEANDGITPMADGTLFLTQEGSAYTGTWTYAAGRLNVTIKNPDSKLSFKIISLADSRLVLEYQYPAPDLSKVKYYYEPKK
jgi:hypothetical protein